MQLHQYFAVSACCAVFALPLSFGQADTSPKPANVALAAPSFSPADSLSAMFGQIQEEVVGAAEAMPADKYDFAPAGTGDFKGVRTFGEQVRHIAQANYHFFRGWGVAGEIDPKTLNSLKTKDELVKALRDSFGYEQAAINSITPENAFAALSGFPPQVKATRVSIAAYAMAHSMDHYGQMVEYLRMNGIVPPASRQNEK
jgi:uncharacterized damage-inducible protein DinB